jgi:pectin methylesterase-like acyl-CoA thioesterase
MGEYMNKLILAITATFLIIIVPAQATIYVGGEAGLASISEAIEAATENETIIVYEGIYRENVVIDKPLILKAAGNVTVEAADNGSFSIPFQASTLGNFLSYPHGYWYDYSARNASDAKASAA